MRLSVKTNAKSLAKQIERFNRDLKKHVVHRGLDTRLKKDLGALKAEILSKLNDQVKTYEEEKPQAGESQSTQTKLLDVPRSEVEIIKHLTEQDISKMNKNKDFTNETDAPIFRGHTSNNTDNDNRFRMRVQHRDWESPEQHYARASKVIDGPNTLFAFNFGGENTYHTKQIKDRKSLMHFLKLVCSITTGGDSDKALTRFHNAAAKNGWIEYTVKQEAVHNIVKREYLNLTPIVKDIQNGDFAAAKDTLKAKKQTPETERLITKVEEVEKGENLNPSMKAYTDLVKLVKSLKIHKELRGDKVIYSLVSTMGSIDLEDNVTGTFMTTLTRATTYWKLTNFDMWFNVIVKKLVKLIRRIESL